MISSVNCTYAQGKTLERVWFETEETPYHPSFVPPTVLTILEVVIEYSSMETKYSQVLCLGIVSTSLMQPINDFPFIEHSWDGLQFAPDGELWRPDRDGCRYIVKEAKLTWNSDNF